MEHLTIEDIIQFVTISVIDENSIRLASRVNAHILQCDLCRKRVYAFQTVYDEFARMEKPKGSNESRMNEIPNALKNEFEAGGYR